MCRLFAYTGNLEDADFKSALQEFAKLAETGCVPCGLEPGHLDGWGIVGSTDSEMVHFRSIEKVDQEKMLNAISIKSGRGQFMGHLRKASVGQKLLCNTHPFVRAGIGFCHNGSIHAFPKTSFTEDRHYREGHTDSETFFLRILDRLNGQIGDASINALEDALRQEVDEIKQTSEWSSLICMLICKEGIVVNYLWNENHPRREELKFDDYYTLFVGKKEGGTIICSEKLDIEDVIWEKLSNGSMITL